MLNRYFFLRGQADALYKELNSVNDRWKDFTDVHSRVVIGLTQCDSKLTNLQYVDVDADEQELDHKAKLSELLVRLEINKYVK